MPSSIISDLIVRANEFHAHNFVSQSTKASLWLACRDATEANARIVLAKVRLEQAIADLDDTLFANRGERGSRVHKFDDEHYSKVTMACVMAAVRNACDKLRAAIAQAEGDITSMRDLLQKGR